MCYVMKLRDECAKIFSFTTTYMHTCASLHCAERERERERERTEKERKERKERNVGRETEIEIDTERDRELWQIHFFLLTN